MSIDPELAAIATHAARLSADQVRALRDTIVTEIASLEASIDTRERASRADADQFDIRRDRATCARRRREVDYLNQLMQGSAA